MIAKEAAKILKRDLAIMKKHKCLPDSIEATEVAISTFEGIEKLKEDMKALNCGYPYGLDYLLNSIKNNLGVEL